MYVVNSVACMLLGVLDGLVFMVVFVVMLFVCIAAVKDLIFRLLI